MKNQSKVQNSRFNLSILLIRAEHPQYVLRSSQLSGRIVDIETMTEFIVVVSLIGVDRQHRECRDEVDALAEYIFKGCVICVFVVGCQRQHGFSK